MPGMGPRRRVTTRRVAGSRRKLIWATYVAPDVQLAAAPTFSQINLLGDLSTGTVGVVGATVLRTIGVAQVDWTGGSVGDRVDMGLIRADLDQVGSAAPADNLVSTGPAGGRQWAYLTKWLPDSTGGGLGAQTYHFDVRSKRKMDERGVTYLGCFARITGTLPATLSIRLHVRTLLALP